jgi:hypothetical protein
MRDLGADFSTFPHPETGLSALKSGKMPSPEKLLSTAHQLLAIDKALARGLPIPQRSAFFVLRVAPRRRENIRRPQSVLS